jgi:hypothetical protein
MKFSVRRTSTNGDDMPPCEGCERIGPPADEVAWGGEVTWVKEVNSLEELWSLIGQHGRVILDPQDWRHLALPMLEIYDGHRE